MQEKTEFRFTERIMIQHAHPAKLAIDIGGVLTGWDFLWIHQLLFALIALFGVSLFGTMLVWRQDIGRLYQTTLGKWMIIQAEPRNLIVRSIGFAVVCYGFWSHALPYFPIGIVIIIAARLLGNNASK